MNLARARGCAVPLNKPYVTRVASEQLTLRTQASFKIDPCLYIAECLFLLALPPYRGADVGQILLGEN